MGEAPRMSTATIAAPPSAVWFAVGKVYAAFDIPVTVANPAAHQMGNPSFYKTRRLAGQPMETLVDCGSSMTGKNAATFRMDISLLTNVLPDTNGTTKVQTAFIPVGMDMSGNAGDHVLCTSTRKFEALFLDSVRAVVKR